MIVTECVRADINRYVHDGLSKSAIAVKVLRKYSVTYKEDPHTFIANQADIKKEVERQYERFHEDLQ